MKELQKYKNNSVSTMLQSKISQYKETNFLLLVIIRP